jgi:hypothetical protein
MQHYNSWLLLFGIKITRLEKQAKSIFPSISEPSAQQDPRTATDRVDQISRPSVEEGLAPFLGHAEDQKGNNNYWNTEPFAVTYARKSKGQEEGDKAVKSEVPDLIAVRKGVEGCDKAGEVSAIGRPHDVEKESENEACDNFDFHRFPPSMYSAIQRSIKFLKYNKMVLDWQWNLLKNYRFLAFSPLRIRVQFDKLTVYFSSVKK